MGYKLFRKGVPTSLSANFNSTEFDCHGSGCCSQTKINLTLVEYLQKIRDHFGVPITITSGYRCPTHNSKPSVGGATRSKHCQGDAADIVVKGVKPAEVAKFAESIGILGIGLYETAIDGYFVHIDTRTVKYFWYGQRQKAMTTFGGAQSVGTITNNNSVNTNTVDTILDRGDSGDAVQKLQEKLIQLGYSCGSKGADGVFGNATYNAVRKFQRETPGLSVDGIVGYQTITAIDAAISALKSSQRVVITASVLNVRSGPGMNNAVVSTVRKGSVCFLAEESGGWGRIINPAGWVSLQYCKKQ